MGNTTTTTTSSASSGRMLLALALVAASGVSAAPTTSDGAYSLIADYSGPGFFDAFTTFTGPDPTNGHVNYTDMDFAAEQKLLGYVFHSDTNTTSAYIGVDHTNSAPNGRNSVRLISKETFDAGSMFVIDTNHIPVGDGLWPAIWTLGSQGTWPASGEIDILEYVHETSYNGMTLHTSPGCNIDNSTQAFQGRLLNNNCNAGNAATGCSIAAFDQNTVARTNTRMATAGFAMNKQGGGVYVADWQADGITIWMFPHSAQPADLLAGTPNPRTWKQKPLAKFAGSCDFTKAFEAHQLIINLDFCGDWAGKTWEADGAAQRTGVKTCNDYVANNPKAFKDAYFDLASIKVFSSSSSMDGKKMIRRDDENDRYAAPAFGYVNVTRPCDEMNMTETKTKTAQTVPVLETPKWVNGTGKKDCSSGNDTRTA